MSSDYRQQQQQELELAYSSKILALLKRIENLDKVIATLKKVECGMTNLKDADFLASELSVKAISDQTRENEHEQT